MDHYLIYHDIISFHRLFCSVNHQISTEVWTLHHSCGSALCSKHCLSPNDSATVCATLQSTWVGAIHM